MKKVFLQTQFGSPHSWTEKYFENFRVLEQYGWYLKVFTPNSWKSEGNIEIIPMTVEEFDTLIDQRCGVRANNYLTDEGVPAKLVSDYYPAYGQIFQDFIHGFDFWGHTNWDMVYGRLDHFVSDQLLEQWDIWSDDVNAINGIFCLYRNNEQVNNLFRKVPNWQRSFTVHEPCAFDEIQMTMLVRQLVERGLRFGYPPYFGYHSYDRLIQHVPVPNIYFEPDGALIERFEDPLMSREIFPEGYFSFPKGAFGREIMSFHFIRTKQWPTCLTDKPAWWGGIHMVLGPTENINL